MAHLENYHQPMETGSGCSFEFSTRPQWQAPGPSSIAKKPIQSCFRRSSTLFAEIAKLALANVNSTLDSLWNPLFLGEFTPKKKKNVNWSDSCGEPLVKLYKYAGHWDRSRVATAKEKAILQKKRQQVLLIIMSVILYSMITFMLGALVLLKVAEDPAFAYSTVLSILQDWPVFFVSPLRDIFGFFNTCCVTIPAS